jgi:hypothetical protein
MADTRGWVLLPGRDPVEIEAGGMLSFGRAVPGQAVDLTVSGSPRVSRRAGVLEPTPYGILLTNTGSNPIFVRLGVEPASISLRPGQAYLVTEGKARVTFAGVSDYFEIEVGEDGRPVVPDDADDRTVPGEPTMTAFGLNEQTAYFRCLVALCEPTLRNPQSPWIPTSAQIAERLYEYGLIAEERDGDWVDRRLDDVRAKLPIGEKPWTAEQARSATPEEAKQAMARERSGAPRRTARKEQLVEFAITNGLVTLETVRRMFG